MSKLRETMDACLDELPVTSLITERYSGYEPDKSEDVLKDVGFLAEELKRLNELKEYVDAISVQLGKDITSVGGYYIPKLMSMANIQSFTTEDGKKLSCKETVLCSLPKEDMDARKRALDWINEQGGGSLIKDNLTVESPNAELLAYVEGKFNCSRKKDIHPQSLKSFMSELLGFKKNSIAQLDVEEVPPELHLFIKKETVVSK